MSRFTQWLRRNDIGLGSIVAFVVVPFVAAVIAAVDRLGVAWWTLTPEQLWSIFQAAAYSVGIGLVGRFGQAFAQKWGTRVVVDPRPDDITITDDVEDIKISAGELV